MIGTGNDQRRCLRRYLAELPQQPDTLPAKCGLNVALIIDISGSVAFGLPSLKTAAKTFINSRSGPLATRAVHLRHHRAGQHHQQPESATVPDVDRRRCATVNTWIDGLTATGGTNWDRGLSQVAESGTTYDVAVVITDGNPTFYGNPAGPRELHPLPRDRERDLLGQRRQGQEHPDDRLRCRRRSQRIGEPTSSPSPVRPLDCDYYQTTDYAAAGAALRALALGNCVGSVSVDQAGRAEHRRCGQHRRRCAGRRLDLRRVRRHGGCHHQSGDRDDGRRHRCGELHPHLSGRSHHGAGHPDRNPAEWATPWSPVSGSNAVCTRLDTSAAAHRDERRHRPGLHRAGASTYPVSCNVYNRHPTPRRPSRWPRSGSSTAPTFDEGLQPNGLNAALTIAGTAQGWGVVRTGLSAGRRPCPSPRRPRSRCRQCTLTANRVTRPTGPSSIPRCPSADPDRGREHLHDHQHGHLLDRG